jgi:glycyl-tRNA synthetase
MVLNYPGLLNFVFLTNIFISTGQYLFRGFLMKSDRIMDIAKRRGFFWQSSALYGGLAGFFDYAHLGAALKRKWENVWREFFLVDENFHEIEPSQIMHEKTFKASGHLESFIDPTIKCRKCLNVERADHLLKDILGGDFEGISLEDMKNLITKHRIKCPKCKGKLEEVGILNMMFPIDVGTGDSAKAYLSPETAQGAYLNFKQEFETLRRRMPLGLAVVGKAFRNEISPRNMLIRMREFTQAELQIFFDPQDMNKHPRFSDVASYKLVLLPLRRRKSQKVVGMTCRDAVRKLGLPKMYVYFMAFVQKFYLDTLRIPKKIFRLKELSGEEKAFYNKYHWDVEIDLESVGGFGEVAGVHYRTDHDLLGHQKVSGESMEVSLEGKKFIPHVLELSFGVDRNVYALFEVFYREEKDRTLFRFPGIVSPFDAGVFPLVNKDGLPEKAREVQKRLVESGFQVFYDSSGSIGRRYRRIDEVGVIAGITVDHQTLKDGTVTLRDRDSMKQVRISLEDIAPVLKRFISGEKIETLGKIIN